MKPRNSSEDPEEFRATLVEHLDELRTRIFRIAALLLVGWIAGWYLQPFVYAELDGLVHRSLPNIEFKTIVLDLTGPFMLKLRFSFVLGLMLVLPFVALQLWGFVAPGLKPSEKRPLKIVAPLSVLLFALGVTMCWIALPNVFAFFASFLADFQGTELHQEQGKLIFFTLKMLGAFGLAFQLPLILYFLVRIGVLTPETLSSYWRQAIVVIFIFAGIITPDPSLFSMLMMAVPMTLLFFATIFFVKVAARKDKKRELEEAAKYSLDDDFDRDDAQA